MLKRVAIHNYHCFVDFELELPQKLLIVGSNGSGKTSLWEVLVSIQDVVVRSAEVATAFPTRSLTRWLRGEPVQRVALDLALPNGAYRYEIEVVHDVPRRAPSIQRELLTVDGERLYDAVDGEVRLYGDAPQASPRARIPAGRKRSFLGDLEPRPDNQRTLAFRDALANLWLLKPSPQRLEPTSAKDAPWLDRDGQNFASWYRSALVERSEFGRDLLEALRPAMPGLQDLSMQSVSREARELMLKFRTSGADYQLSVSELSDGQRTLLLLYGFLFGAFHQAALAFVDEPEAGLAPHEMQPWLSALSRAVDDHDGQVLVTSHHPAVIDYLASTHTVRFSRPHGGAVRAEEVTQKTTGGTTVSEWLSPPWAYEEEYDESAA